MSYCRFSQGEVYFYAGSEGWECCACRLVEKVPTIFSKGLNLFGRPTGEGPCPDCGGQGCDSCSMPGSYSCETIDEAIDHIKDHRAAGHQFPYDEVMARLLVEKQTGAFLL